MKEIKKTYKIMSQQHHPINCQQCRNSHIKCDKVLPQCANCARSGKTCVYTAPKRNRTARVTTTTCSSSEESIQHKSNKRPRVTQQETIGRELVVSIPPQEIVQYYLSELDDCWTFFPKTLLNQVVNTSGASLNFDHQHYTIMDVNDYEERVHSLLWNSIVLLSVQHMSIQHNDTGVAANDLRHKLKTMANYLEQRCESTLLQADVHKRITSDHRLAFATSFLSFYLNTFDDKVGQSKIWMNTTKAALDTIQSSIRLGENNNTVDTLRMQYLSVKFMAMTNSFDISKPYDYKYCYKILKSILELIELYESFSLIVAPPGIFEENLNEIVMMFKQFSKNNVVTIEQIQVIIELTNEMIMSCDTDISFYKCHDNLKIVTILSHNIFIYGIVQELLKYEEEKMRNSRQYDQLMLHEIYKMQLLIADNISSQVLSGSSEYMKFGIMQIRPLLIAADVHIKAAIRAGAHNVEFISSIRTYLMTDKWLLELLQTKYQLPASALSILHQLHQQIMVTQLQLSLPQPAMTTSSQTEQTTEFLTNMDHSSDAPSFLTDDIDISDLL
jgi:hypothetical protein